MDVLHGSRPRSSGSSFVSVPCRLSFSDLARPANASSPAIALFDLYFYAKAGVCQRNNGSNYHRKKKYLSTLSCLALHRILLPTIRAVSCYVNTIQIRSALFFADYGKCKSLVVASIKSFHLGNALTRRAVSNSELALELSLLKSVFLSDCLYNYVIMFVVEVTYVTLILLSELRRLPAALLVGWQTRLCQSIESRGRMHTAALVNVRTTVLETPRSTGKSP